MDLLGSILGKMEKPPVIKKSTEEQERIKSKLDFSEMRRMVICRSSLNSKFFFFFISGRATRES